jgi:DNA polymerase III alpha subunit
MHTHFINRKKGKEDYELHPILEPYLRKTYGVLVFQEQVMQILHVVGDIPLKDCEIVRKAISKKKEKVFLKYKVMFLENGQKNLGWTLEQVQALFDQVVAFAEYGFNAAHATAYTYISSRLLYLKAHYPIEFFAGILESETNEDKIKEYKLDAERFGIQVNPVDLNKSGVNFKILDKEIFIGFSNIKGLGVEVAQRIVSGQPYASFEDFLVRFGTDANVLKPLIGLGVFAECQREPWVVPVLSKVVEVEDVEVDEESPQIKVTAVGETITVNPRVALFEFAEFYKGKMKKRDDRFKRNRKSLDGRVEELRFLLPEDLKDQAGDEWFLKRLEMSEDAFTLVMNAVGGLDVKGLWKVLLKYKKSYVDNQKKVAADGPVLLKDFVPTGDIESKLKLIYEDDLLASELAYYGFGWNHMLEKSPDYEGGYTFAELGRRAEEQGVVAGMVEVQVIEVPKLKKSKKETNYYVLRVEDNEWQQAGVTVWEDDYERFEEEFNFWESESRRGNLLKCRLMVPTPPFKNYTFYAPPKHRRHLDIPEDKALDPRLAVMRRS